MHVEMASSSKLCTEDMFLLPQNRPPVTVKTNKQKNTTGKKFMKILLYLGVANEE